jgi:hypothetical protein
MYRWLRDNGFPEGFQILCLSLCHCNEIKLLEKEFGTDRTARDGHARAARCATPQPEQ